MYDFAWGMTKTAFEQGYTKLPKERIFITHDPLATGHQRANKAKWSPVINLYMTDDYFKSLKLMLAAGNSLIKTENYMYVAKSSTNQLIQIYVSTLLSGFSRFEEIKVPGEPILSKGFTIMDTSEQTVFLHVQG